MAMASASIGEPFVVASFDVPASTRPSRSYIGATAVESAGGEQELTLTVHGHSIHTVEVRPLLLKSSPS